MTLAEFKSAPWGRSHQVYRSSDLSIQPAPEYASSEVLLASLYRLLGFGELTERVVPTNGRELDRSIDKARDRQDRPPGAALDGEAMHALLHGVMQSPKLQNQSTRRFLQVAPLVGEAAWFSGAARQAGNPWPAGMLVRRMVWLGAGSDMQARELWLELFQALAVGEDDDVFAKFLREELRSWTGQKWGPGLPSVDADGPGQLAIDEIGERACPARRFARDLQSVLDAKPLLTRRQWISMLEALVRLAAVAHVYWLAEVQARLWDLVRRVAAGAPPPADVGEHLYPRQLDYLTLGVGAVAGLKDRTSRYLRARLGINAVLWSLEDKGVGYAGSLSSATDVDRFLVHMAAHRQSIGGVLDEVEDLFEAEARVLRCAKGIGSNMMEFARHVLYQRSPADPSLRGYDQGFALRRRGAARNAHWICAPGPVAVLTLVHCSLAGINGPRSVQKLARQMADYGIAVDHRDIARNELGHQLRILGLVLDSPDAETGMLLVPPFGPQGQAARA